MRTDLFLGAGRTGASAWESFLADIVTPRFPDGFTVIEARGQWRGGRGLVRERTHVLVISHRAGRASDRRIESIRTIYERRFAQTSVLRADGAACVAF